MIRTLRPKQTPVKLTKEEKEIKKQQILDNKYWRLEKKREKEGERLHKKRIRQNVNILKYMKKNNVIFYHHNQEESMMYLINRRLEYIKTSNKFEVYDGYMWNHIDSNYTPLCLLECLWSRDCGFDSIYDVPLNDEYEFYITDSGSRGLGSYNYLHLKKVESKVHVPFVNPGGLIPITAM
jgi:hypothetical protein